MSENLNVGDVVVCVDAADIPSPPWKPLETGKLYVIRSIELADVENSHYDKNIHKKSRYCVRLWGVLNMTNRDAAAMLGLASPFGLKELGYADSRFEKVNQDSEEFEEVSSQIIKENNYLRSA